MEASAGQILLVDDNPNDRELLMRELGRGNLADRVRVAVDGAKALDYVFAHFAESENGSRPEVIILLDLHLPKVNGLEVLRRIRADERTKSIPIVVVTSSTSPRDRSECYRHGADNYVVKPMSLESFLQAASELGFDRTLLNRWPERRRSFGALQQPMEEGGDNGEHEETSRSCG